MAEMNLGEKDPIEQRLDLAFRQGVLGEIAATAINGEYTLEPSDAADIILPPKKPGEKLPPRWQLVDGAPDVIKSATNERADQVLTLAVELGMRKEQSLDEADLTRIDAEKAVWVVEGGANRTGVVRRTIAIQAMQMKYGADISDKTIYQFGSNRAIPRERDGKLNKEYGVAQELAAEYLPSDDSLDEFGLNLAGALQEGYQIQEDTGSAVIMRKGQGPVLALVRVQGGLESGFSAVHSVVEGGLSGRQLVISTNGQYRPKDEIQAQIWARKTGIETLPAVAIGDEPGFALEHNGHTIVTGERTPVVYVNEMVVVKRLQETSKS